jgi:uncharacterized repeat protein (TIGR01451 family)
VVTGGGNITVTGDIDSIAQAPAGVAGDGGDVTLAAGGSLNATVDIYSYVQSATGSGDAGDISITATGPLTLTTLSSYSRFSGVGFSGNSGDVNILVHNSGALDGGDDLRLNYIWSDSGAWYYGGANGPSGDGAGVSLVTEDGDIIFDNWLWVQTLARRGSHNSGSGGTVVVTATNGGFSVSNYGINTQSQVASGGNGNAGKGGNVTITAEGVITNPTFGGIETRSVALSGNTSGGGNVLLRSTGGNIDFGSNDINTLSDTGSGQAGKGGNITLEAAGTITLGHIRSHTESDSGKAGKAGAVVLSANNDIQVTSLNATALGGGGNGAGGIVTVDTNQFFRVTGLTPFTTSIATQGLAKSSAVTITHGGGGITPFIVGDASTNGTAGVIATGDASLNPTQPYLYTHFEAPNIWIISVPSPLAISKAADPSANAPYQGNITYTIVISNNSGTAANGVLLTDTLPGQVDFDGWVQKPSGAGVAVDEITWNGAVPANGQVTFSFVVSHTGVYSEVVINTAHFSQPTGGVAGSDEASFKVEADPGSPPPPENLIYIPMVVK